MGFLCCGRSKVFCICMPIGVAAFLFSVIWILNGILRIVEGCLMKDPWGSNEPDPWTVGYGAYMCFAGIAGVIVTLWLHYLWASILLFCVNVGLFIATIVIVVVQWLFWSNYMNQTPPVLQMNWKMPVWTVFHVIFLVMAWLASDFFWCFGEMCMDGLNPWVPGGEEFDTTKKEGVNDEEGEGATHMGTSQQSHSQHRSYEQLDVNDEDSREVMEDDAV